MKVVLKIFGFCLRYTKNSEDKRRESRLEQDRITEKGTIKSGVRPERRQRMIKGKKGVHCTEKADRNAAKMA